MNYSSDSLIDTIRLRAGIPAQALVSNAQILEAINYELRQTILPMVIEAGAEYYVTFEDFEITTEGIYKIPALAVGKKLRDIQIVDGQTDPNLRNSISIIPQMTISNIPQNYIYNQQYTGQRGFVVMGNTIRIIPPNVPIQGNYLRMYYYRRPNECVPVSEGSTITVTSSTQFTVPSVPSGFGATPTIDILQSIPSFDIVESGLAATVAGVTFTVSSTANMTTGDKVNLTGETSYPQMPVDLQNMLIQSVCMRMYEITRDQTRLTLASQMYDKMKSNTLKLISPRVDGRPVKITSNNGISNFI